ncbi:hypothetical protein NECAME_04207 [Necator americanus]|uniref:Thioredoxin n=1 Tax=Necator americanus TaxID=51031 RepID=W2SWI1_NECAM|nr:hypothetical protein NECAME_04207 [Necator americanus]ETN73985.1 hypothetical protein NECAME_04207 [Necator americanus]
MNGSSRSESSTDGSLFCSYQYDLVDMWSPLTVSLLFLISVVITVTAEHVNIDVYSHTKDDTRSDAIRRVVSAINADNRFVVARVIERDCDGADLQECSGHDKEDAFISIHSPEHTEVKVSGLIRKNFRTQEEMQNLFLQFSSEFYLKRSEEIDNINWWAYELTAPSVKHLEQLDKLIGKSKERITFALYYEPEGFSNFAAYYAAGDLFSKGSAYGLVVDCSKEKAICTRESIQTLPALISYDKGKQYKRYSHDMDIALIRDWIKTIQQPIITKLTEDAVPYYREGGVPGFDEPRPSVIMFFSATRKSDIYKDYKQFARKHHGDYHLTEIVDRGIEKWAHQPAFVAMKPLETITKANTLYEDITYEKIAEFIEENRHPSVHHLTDGRALFTAFSLGRPVLIFYDITKTKSTLFFSTLASNYPVRSTVAAFAMSQGLSMPGLFLAQLLKVDVLKPCYVLVDVNKNCVYTQRIANENEMEIEHWLKTVANEDCQEANLNMEKLAALKHWTMRDDLRRAVEEQLSSSTHEEL